MTISKEGYKIIAFSALIFTAIDVLAVMFLPLWLAIPILAPTIFLLGFEFVFFRMPKRQHIEDPQIVFSPCDGEVVVCEEVTESEYLGDKRIQLSVFMSLTNVHANWYPVGGKVVYFKHHHGKFLVAWHPKSSEENERTTTVVDTGKHKILFRQIAGYVARRIVSYAKEGTNVGQNTQCGFIKFGSRVDLHLPLDTEILVKIGDKVTGSQTPLAKLK